MDGIHHLQIFLRQTLDFIAGGPQASTAEAVLRGSLLTCTLFALAQLQTMLRTRWGDHHTMRKTLFLSLLVHFCLALGGAAAVQQARRLTPQTSETQPLLIRQVRVSTPTPTLRENSANAAVWDRPTTSQQEFTRLTPILAETEAPTAPIPDRVPAPQMEQQPARLPQIVVAAKPETEPPPDLAPAPSTSVSPEVARNTPAVDSIDVESPARQPETGPAIARQRSREPTAASARSSTAVVPSRQQPTTGPAFQTTSTEELVARRMEIASADQQRHLSPVTRTPDREFDPQVTARTPARSRNSRVAPVVGRMRGVVTHAETGAVLAGASIRFDQADGSDIVAETDAEGRYELAFAETPENFVITATQDGFLPESKNVRSREILGRVGEFSFALRPATERVIALEENPTVHHLGNDQFEGKVNSRFQGKTEGSQVRLVFDVSEQQVQLGSQQHAVLTFVAKGIECPPEIRLNGRLISQDLDISPADGSFGRISLAFPSKLLRSGRNTLEVKSVTCHGDLDDFEYVNVQIRIQQTAPRR